MSTIGFNKGSIVFYKSEQYKMSDITWVKKEVNYAVYLFNYHWSGIIKDKMVSGNGIGTSVIIKERDNWHLLVEHLGKKMD